MRGTRSAVPAAKVVALLFAAWALAIVPVTPASGETNGSITFRLQLKGEAPPTDSFLVLIDPSNAPYVIEHTWFCGPERVPWYGTDDAAECRAMTYEFTFQLPVGTQLDFTFIKTGSLGASTTLFQAKVTVTRAEQIRYLVYDYSLDSNPSLPNTALPNRPAVGVPWHLSLAAAVAVWFAARRRWLSSRAG